MIRVTSLETKSWRQQWEHGFEVWVTPFGEIVRAPRDCVTPDVVVSYKRLPDTPFVLKEKSLSYVRARKRQWREAHGLRARGYTD